MMGIKEHLLLWQTKFSDKTSKGNAVDYNEIKQDLQLVKELHKPIIGKEQFIPDSKTMFGVLILLICNH